MNIDMNLTNINIKQFINNIISFDNIDDILDTFTTQSEKGFVFERLFDIVIKFGFCDEFINSQFYHMHYKNNPSLLTVVFEMF